MDSEHLYSFPKFKNLPVFTNKILGLLQSKIQSKASGTESFLVSTDLNLTSNTLVSLDFERKEITLLNQSFKIPASFDPKDNVCYFLQNGFLHKLSFHDVTTGYSYTLAPTSFRPILRVSATQMHKKPFLDMLENQNFIGNGLDGGTGLGYSAIIAANSSNSLETVEWDKNVIEIASYNPHSRDLFEKENIKFIHADLTKYVEEIENETFDFIIQDGGTPKSSGLFFSQTHADHLFRILKNNGQLYFYLPKKGITKGRDFGSEQIKRMKKAGFSVKTRNKIGSYTIFKKN